MGKKQISSAGLVYFHLCGKLLENNELCLEQTNSYSYFEKGFYTKVKAQIVKTQDETDIVHLMGVIGESYKVDMIKDVVVEGIKDNAQRIIDGKKLKKKTSFLDEYGNVFYQLIQEYFYEDLGHFPFGNAVGNSQCTAYYVYAGEVNNENIGSIASGMVELWIEKEEATLFGKQLMIRSFFMRDFIDRRVIACLPSRENNLWNVVLEGGIKIVLDSEMSYRKELLQCMDMGFFSTSGLGDMIMETAYAFGKTYYPRELCAEWQKVFLFLCAIQDKEWDVESFSDLYNKFLRFLENNICYTIEVPAIMSKEIGLEVLLIELKNMRNFLQGKEEIVISKDFLHTLGSRYVYIPHLMDLFSVSEAIIRPFSRIELEQRLSLAVESDLEYEKGELWEDATSYIIDHIAGWKITGRRIRTGYQEIDISVANVSYSDKLWELGAYILVECKNWCKKVNISVIRNIAYNVMMKGNKTALLFSINGITEDARKEIVRLAVNHIYILSIEKKDLVHLFTEDDCTNLILDKWRQLQESIENELPI